jgi:hypothetical protein
MKFTFEFAHDRPQHFTCDFVHLSADKKVAQLFTISSASPYVLERDCTWYFEQPVIATKWDS